MRKAFIIGHHEKSKGAYSPILKISEWDLYKSIEQELSKIGDVYVHNPNIVSYTQRMVDTANRVNEKEYDMVISLHFNSYNGGAEGCEALYISNRGGEIAKNFCHFYTSYTKSLNRGHKKISSASRGYQEIFNPKAPAILIEPFFGDNRKDCQLFDKTKLLEALKCL